MTAGNVRRWLHQHQHVVGVRQALDLAETAYQGVRRLRREDEVPAMAGAWPARWIPLPSPRPFAGPERRRLRSLMRRQVTSFSDGDELLRFERELAAALGAKNAVAVSSGTAALHAMYACHGLGPGDEVLVPALSYVSCALAVRYTGADVRFVDAEPRTWNIDPEGVRSAIGPRTKAILAVHLAGVPCDMEALADIARERGLLLLEDAAQAHGARYGGRHVGTLGCAGAFSFQSAKTMVTGEGGAILCADDDLADALRRFVNLGEFGPGGGPSLHLEDFAEGVELGYAGMGRNYRLGALACAQGRGQLERLPAIVSRRRELARELGSLLMEVDGAELQQAPEDSLPCPSSLFVRLPETIDRTALHSALARERIDVRLPPQRPLPAEPLFGGQAGFPVAEALCARAIGFKVDPSYGRREIRAMALAFQRNARALGGGPRRHELS